MIFFQHQEYTGTLSSVYINDIALLKLATNMSESPYFTVVQLATPDHVLTPVSECLITGWGIAEKRTWLITKTNDAAFM